MATSPSPHQHSISRADFLIKTLNLAYLPRESGYIGLLGRSPHNITPPSALTVQDQTVASSALRALAAQSHNYYLLTAKYPTNYLHLLTPDDTHILIEGGPVEYYVFTPLGPTPILSPASSSTSATHAELPKAELTVLGKDYLAGQTPIISVPGGCWKALRLCEGAEYALMANVLSPEFTEDRVVIGAGRKFVEMFQGRARWACEKFLRELIGDENWVDEQDEML